MTIGIAARGPRAGDAILKGLAVAETVGHGAIGGFVSFVAITAAGELHRAETQDGGTAALPPLPTIAADAVFAALMSSGPNRPAPLAQFTPGDPAVGLVTGHRMPNTPGGSGLDLNEDVLARMRAGDSAETAVSAVAAANPGADAGLIALSRTGGLAFADTALIGRLPDAGRAYLAEADAAVAVLHNAIRPWRSLALLVAESAMEVMLPAPVADAVVRLSAGVPLEHGDRDGFLVDSDSTVRRILVSDPKFLEGRWSLGLGAAAPVLREGRVIGRSLAEPYLVLNDGCVEWIDGVRSFSLPVRLRAT